ncbi:hypothetical protein ACIQU5_36165 [Streptomyces sp. NPDC090306]|uniref:hypothetical protein n=1 Tax=Streptomyces sp. NPDC090306 TaxID=3365961 RepID=UPI00382AB337
MRDRQDIGHRGAPGGKRHSWLRYLVLLLIVVAVFGLGVVVCHVLLGTPWDRVFSLWMAVLVSYCVYVLLAAQGWKGRR